MEKHQEQLNMLSIVEKNKFSGKTSIHEMKDGSSGKNIKDEYSTLIQFLEKQNRERLRSINKKIEFVLKEQGITFGETRQDGYVERAWYLDLIPHIITEPEFSHIEKGIKQRLIALNKLLLDLYTKQTILKDKIIPHEIILGDPNYLRDCQNVKVPKDIYLHIGAFDIAKSPDGEFVVIDDNVTIPSGISYGMINRQILRRQFSDVFDFLPVRKIWDTMPTMLSILKECAPTNENNPKVVLLSPGIYNEAYSEHELLANNMGIPLVMPKDLIVKENHVFMKTVYGLSKVDVIYRRIQDFYIDPVCFFQDSVLGVPGLFSCVRHGNVTVVNAIGSGIASSKALLPFMDEIIRYYLSEEPILKTNQSYLLDNKKITDHVFENIEEFVIKPRHGTGGKGLLIGVEADKDEIDEFKKLVKADPYEYIAQHLLPLSKTRVFTPEGFRERYIETRFYSFLGKSFHLSNCALTRVSREESTLMVCNSMGGGSKDTWILGKAETRIIDPANIHQFPKNFILSRVAESLFWLGRYVNRGFTSANVLLVAFSSEIDILLGNEDPSYASLMRTLSRLTGSPVRRILQSKESWQIAFFRHAVADSRNPYSIRANIHYAMNNSREIQNYLSNDMWVSLRKLTEYLSVLPVNDEGNISVDDLSEWLVGVVHYSQSFFGASLDGFARQDILKFIQLGRYIEHCNYIIIVLRSTIQFLVKSVQNNEEIPNLQPFLIVILKILNAYEAYQWNYQSVFDPYLAYKMIVIDKDFNNSLVSCMEKIKTILESTRYDSQQEYDTDSAEYICDILISRAFSFNLKENLTRSTNSKIYHPKEHFHFTKEETRPGFWSSHLRAGIDLLGNKIMDRYSNIVSPTPFSMVN